MPKLVTKQISRREYECEICGRTHLFERDANKCEAGHGCMHLSTKFEYILDDDAWRFRTDGIQKVCDGCGKVIDSVLFEDFENNQEVLKSIYENTTRKQ
jgi:hypothetical protein